VEAVQRRSLLPSVENTGALSTKLAPPSLTIPSPSFTLLRSNCVSPFLQARFEIQRLYKGKKKKQPEALRRQEEKEQEEQARRPGSR